MTSDAASPTAQHAAVLAVPAWTPPEGARPEPGPIAVLPEPEEAFVRAIESAGGTVAPLGDDTRGLVWLSSKHPDELQRVLDGHPRIGWVQLPWAGVDAFAPLLAANAGASRVWTSAKGAYAQPVAEHALMLALASLRLLPRRLAVKHWEGREDGRSLFGLRVVILGAGGIALELLRLLEPFGTHATIVRRSPEPVPGAERTVTSDRLGEVLPEADVVFVAAALTSGTSKLIGVEEFRAMPAGAVLVNIARGGLVDTDALVDALTAGEIAGAGVDVTDPEPLPDGHPLWSAPNVIVTPHVADTEEMVRPLLAARVEANVRAFLGEGGFLGVVDPAAGY
ncbi:D-isomer specific 2-hydroxyacid dehydrogenase family protein [Agromyces archimandritae]|uniref:Hydroxyacid dehydrogenase n=1 Tax=Agromyces archimandritae TaxID=2781962 RepID=A0A975FNP7_9MICO|nr:D-isomer specific 2-hydroxyacid dehydrogenase family protein [Agromyces archimandritae]QTX04843.1 hydroxyacid dehydrogenase [Agromyces archimandritae]